MSYLRSKKNTRKKSPWLKKVVPVLIGALILVGIIHSIYGKKIAIEPQNDASAPEIDIDDHKDSLDDIVNTQPLQGSIFVPYWTAAKLGLPALPNVMKHGALKNLIYFGVTPDEDGALMTDEPGYKNLATFSKNAAAIQGKKLLTLRMLDEDNNEAILQNKDRQNKLIDETLALASQYTFDGLVVDLEHSVLPTSDTVTSISQFLENFAQKTHANNLTFAITIYGDTFYRQRPYDIKKIASFTDEILIMAYDMHKSYGEPGPNFPLTRGSAFSYDFTTMINSFLEAVPSEKITVLFGLYGYDWTVDSKDRPRASAKAMTLSKIEESLLPRCAALHCDKKRDDSAKEMTIRYKDEEGAQHVLWYEDSLSIQSKVKFIQSKNVSSVGYWAYGYY